MVEDDTSISRYYQKQQLEDQLRERRERLRESRKAEETARLTELGYTGAQSRLAELMRRERGERGGALQVSLFSPQYTQYRHGKGLALHSVYP